MVAFWYHQFSSLRCFGFWRFRKMFWLWSQYLISLDYFIFCFCVITVQSLSPRIELFIVFLVLVFLDQFFGNTSSVNTLHTFTMAAIIAQLTRAKEGLKLKICKSILLIWILLREKGPTKWHTKPINVCIIYLHLMNILTHWYTTSI